ncbi:MAG: nicotinate-nucleotide adenylyltransferase [Actinomycetota bacterium]
MRIGILGGTFDPPHLAHLHTGEVAYRQLGLDRVLYMPAGAPWQKAGRRVSAPQHRWQMTRLAVSGVDYFEPDDREVHRDGWTYTADTLATFEYDVEIVLILGADSAGGISTWHRAGEVLSRVHLAVAPRPGTTRSEVEEAVGGQAGTTWLDMVSLDISGSLIRERIRGGQPTRFLVRDEVWRYYTTENLYADEPETPVA